MTKCTCAAFRHFNEKFLRFNIKYILVFIMHWYNHYHMEYLIAKYE